MRTRYGDDRIRQAIVERLAREDLDPERSSVVYPGDDRYSEGCGAAVRPGARCAGTRARRTLADMTIEIGGRSAA